jgi:hypothetical protein
MARQQIRNYVFTPGGAGVGTVKMPGNFSQGVLIAVLNATKQQFLYNFADSTLLGTITWQSTPDTNFPQSIDGVTTLTLTTSTATMSAGDELTIYVEAAYPQMRPFATDAVERLRVANPTSLIDADFEYGLQQTKWQSLFVNNDNPSIYEVPGSDTYPNVHSYLTFTGNTIGSSSQQVVILGQGTSAGNNQPNWTRNDYALVWNTDPAGKYPTTTFVTANVPALTQRTISVKSSNGISVGDTVAFVYQGNISAAAAITTTTANLTAGQTSLDVSSAAGISVGSMILVTTEETKADTGFTTELMTVSGILVNTLTVVRNRLGTNRGNAYITSGQRVTLVTQADLGNVTAVPNFTTITVNRSYMNTIAKDDMPRGTVISKCHWETDGTSGTNVEIVQTTVIGNVAANVARFSRGVEGTTAMSSIGTGSAVLRLSGIFAAGNPNLPEVGINIPVHGFVSNEAMSTTNHTNANSEGQYQVNYPVPPNYIFYYPRRSSGLHVGYPLNRFDSYVRYAGFYGTAALPPVVLTTDGGTPSVITATTAYAHGLLPGTPILANIASAGANGQYAHGAFTILTIPTETTFTYQARSGAAVTGSVVGVIYVRPSAFFIHRAADGGVNLGTGTPHHGASAARQSKRYFRYQSGKGIMWTSGTLLGSNFDIVSITAAGTGVGNTITITTDQYHQLQIGANVVVQNVLTTGYNGYYLVSAIISDNTFQVNAQSVLGNITSVQFSSSVGPKLATAQWTGASVRAGMFDDQNGMFWENTGSVINVVQRSATQQTTGYVSVEVATNLLTGDGTCLFTQQFKAGDKIVLRGLTHTVTSIIDDNSLTIAPVWRGLSNQTRIKPTKVFERRYPQSQWNVDPLNGTGPSGYLLDATKMQMLMIQYTWYGAGFVDFGVRGPLGNYIFCHRFMNNNLNYEAFMRSGNLPARYQAVNDTPFQLLRAAMNDSQTTFEIDDSTQFPVATPTSPVYVLIDNEIMKVTGITANVANAGVSTATVTGVTRAATFNLYQDGSNKSFSAGAAASHSANVSVRVISATAGPSLNHWGSAIIMDGGFDTDRGYAYTFNQSNIAFPGGTTTVTAFVMRLAPSVSNQIPGDLGNRDLVNRAQLILQNMTVNYTGANARFLVEGVLNPNNVSTATTTWSYLYNQAQNRSENPSGASQPSYTQLAGNAAIVYNSVPYAWGGERLFAIPVNQTNSGELDLSRVKQLGNSGIPGYNIYPDGPELLAINITSLTTTGGPTGTVRGEIQIQWNESQA